jgi:hypothetical protein
MKTITISLNVPDDFSEFHESQLIRHCQMLASPDNIAIFWGTEDVQQVAPHLTDEEAREVLNVANRRHDANMGINWDVLESIADMLFDRPDEDEDETRPHK